MGLFPTTKPDKPAKLNGMTQEECEGILQLLEGRAKCDLNKETRTALAKSFRAKVEKKWPAPDESEESTDEEE